MSIGQYLLDALERRGVTDIFGVPGDYVLRFDKLIEEHSIRYINATRENTAGYMADAYARLRGIGVACITYGVGVNIANALSQAFVESSPLVVISGSAASSDFSHEIKLHHMINQSALNLSDRTQFDIFKLATVGQVILKDPLTAAQQIDEILDLCQRLKKPVYIEIPRDMVDAPIPPSNRSNISKGKKNNSAAIDEALHDFKLILDKCQKPVLWIGHEIQRFQLQSAILSFAEKYHIPIVSSLLGKTTLNEHHPLFVGVYQGEMSRQEVIEFVNSCDCVLMMGLMLTDVDTGIFTAKLGFDLKINVSSLGVEIGDRHFKDVDFSDFLQRLPEIDLKKSFAHDYPTSQPKKFIPSLNTKTTIKRVFECIQSHLTKEVIVVADIGDALFASADLVLNQNSFLACACFGSLGFATPGSIGVQICMPHNRVMAIVGDGAFQMTSMELSTAVRYQLDPIVIVLNNHGYGTERPIIEGGYNDIQDWNYFEIPRVLKGGIGKKVTTEEELDKALEEAIGVRGNFYLIEVELGKRDFSPAMQRFGKALKNK